jgi:hypothetical protein
VARPFEVRLPLERAYTRESMLGLELLDSVTLDRVSTGMKVTAHGLTGKPIVNASGLFVWLKEPTTKFEKLTIESRGAPFEDVEIPAAQVNRPLHRVELKPLASYPFAPGITAVRGSLYEKRVPLGQAPSPIARVTIRLEWLDDDGTWHPWQPPAVTNAKGDFLSILRLARGQEPRLDAAGKMTIRLFAKRANGLQRQKSDFPLPQGRVADETYAWDELL